jgi:hypothetical protein
MLHRELNGIKIKQLKFYILILMQLIMHSPPTCTLLAYCGIHILKIAHVLL